MTREEVLLQLLRDHHELMAEDEALASYYEGTILKWATERALAGKPWSNCMPQEQQGGIAVNKEVQCNICGDFHEEDCVPWGCRTGDGV